MPNLKKEVKIGGNFECRLQIHARALVTVDQACSAAIALQQGRLNLSALEAKLYSPLQLLFDDPANWSVGIANGQSAIERCSIGRLVKQGSLDQPTELPNLRPHCRNISVYTASQAPTKNWSCLHLNTVQNGVRGLMLDMYDFEDDVWLCHSMEGQCHDFTAFEPAINALKEVEAFLSENPTEIVTIIIEDYVHAPKGLTNLFTEAGLLKYWFPVSKMPANNEDWLTVTDMVAQNYRLLVFTSIASKEADEGIAYQWRYMVENERKYSMPSNSHNPVSHVVLVFMRFVFLITGIHTAQLAHTEGSARLPRQIDNQDNQKTLLGFSNACHVGMWTCGHAGNAPQGELDKKNYFSTIPTQTEEACKEHSVGLPEMVNSCYKEARNKMPNFLAVNFYMRSDGGGVFEAIDKMNGQTLCGCSTVAACQAGAPAGLCKGTTAVNNTPTTTGSSITGSFSFVASSSTSHFHSLWAINLFEISIMVALLM
ncbi:hypothetical protein ACLOJK_007415 [Asimina triloba]